MAEKSFCDEGEAYCWMGCRPLAHNGTCGFGDQQVSPLHF